MSILSSVARAGPSQISVHRTILPLILSNKASVETQRHKSDKVTKKAPPKTPVVSQAGYLKRRQDEKRSKWRKPLPRFMPLPAAQMNHPLFNPSTVANLELPIFGPDTVRKPESVGQPLEITPPDNDPLRIFGLPRKLYLEFRILTKPYTVVRQITKDVVDILTKAKKKSSLGNRMIFTGRAGCGKSFLMLQAVEHCVRDGWVVIYIPRGTKLIDSTTSYNYDLRTQTYLQPAYSFQTLQRMLTVNSATLSKIPLAEDLVLDKQTVPQGTPLSKVIEIAIAERTRTLAQSPLILDAVMRALDVQKGYPVLLAVDEFHALYGKTNYRDPHFQHIQPYHLSLPRMIMEYASGKRSFAHGAFMGSLSLSQTTHPLPIELRDALDLHELNAHPISPFAKRNREMLVYAEGLKKLEVPEKLTLEEAVGVYELWKGRNVIGGEQTFHDEVFLGKYTESCGNARDFVWRGLLGSLDA